MSSTGSQSRSPRRRRTSTRSSSQKTKTSTSPRRKPQGSLTTKTVVARRTSGSQPDLRAMLGASPRIDAVSLDQIYGPILNSFRGYQGFMSNPFMLFGGGGFGGMDLKPRQQEDILKSIERIKSNNCGGLLQFITSMMSPDHLNLFVGQFGSGYNPLALHCLPFPYSLSSEFSTKIFELLDSMYRINYIFDTYDKVKRNDKLAKIADFIKKVSISSVNKTYDVADNLSFIGRSVVYEILESALDESKAFENNADFERFFNFFNPKIRDGKICITGVSVHYNKLSGNIYADYTQFCQCLVDQLINCKVAYMDDDLVDKVYMEIKDIEEYGTSWKYQPFGFFGTGGPFSTKILSHAYIGEIPEKGSEYIIPGVLTYPSNYTVNGNGNGSANN